MSKAIDLTGQRFGRLTVVERVGTAKNRQSLWKCKCDCGNEIAVIGSSLKNNHTTSCGCFKKEQFNKMCKNPGMKSKKKKTFKGNQCKEGTALCRLTQAKSKNNTSGIKGVFWDKSNQKWKAQIYFKKKNINLGLFSTLEAAAKARALAEEEYFQPILDKYKDDNSTHFKCDLSEDCT